MRYCLILLLPFFLTNCQNETPALQQQISSLQAELTATKEQLSAAQQDPTGFVHAVYFWYKEEVTTEQKATFEQSLNELSKVESLEAVYYGRSPVSKREVVDGSFDLAWVCTFADSLAQEAYQVDPIHLKFVEKNKDLWEKVQVYDSFASMGR
ncbi:MAG: Dabb family protein [Saprospiraceae bacterium]